MRQRIGRALANVGAAVGVPLAIVGCVAFWVFVVGTVVRACT